MIYNSRSAWRGWKHDGPAWRNPSIFAIDRNDLIIRYNWNLLLFRMFKVCFDFYTWLHWVWNVLYASSWWLWHVKSFYSSKSTGTCSNCPVSGTIIRNTYGFTYTSYILWNHYSIVVWLWLCYWLPFKFITVTSKWARSRLKSPASPSFTQPFIQAQIKENIKAPRYWPLCREFTGNRWIPAQMASNAENVSIWWRHHVKYVS